MKSLKLKATEKPIQEYYRDLNELKQMRLHHEGAVAPAFSRLLHYCAKQLHLTLSEQHAVRHQGRSLRFDAAFIDEYKLLHGVWEAKDSRDKLEEEVRKKFKVGYPKTNTMFQSPQQVIIWQNGQEVFNQAIDQPAELVRALKLFFEFQPPDIEEWQQAVAEFQGEIPTLAQGLLERIHSEYRTNRRFREAFEGFRELCHKALNPNLATEAIEEMLIQHLLTERIFRKVFNHPEFTQRNVIAAEIEKVILALTSAYFKRDDFLKRLDPFYLAIERNAAQIEAFSEKQAFLNTVYERFFQGYSVKIADTHGIVYTPQPIVDFMVHSVEYLLDKEFGRSLSTPGVQLLDPFVGTGNFIVRLMRQIKRTELPEKYKSDLHCNEVMLLPYYIASLNIEHEYYNITDKYETFDGICFVDTFQLAEPLALPMFSEKNTDRISQQRQAPIFVIIGNPPYNASQVNENDNNRNRKYPQLDKAVSNSYANASRASAMNQLSDPYVKAFRWASDRISEEGIVALVTNNSFIDGLAFDSMRKHLALDFDVIYTLDLGGNVRQNPKLSGTIHNVFGIQVGVSITFLIRRNGTQPRNAQIYYARVDELWRKEQKYEFLTQHQHVGQVTWQNITPNRHNTWLTTNLADEFDTFLCMGTKEGKATKNLAAEVIFKIFSNGNDSGRDSWVHNFQQDELLQNVRKFATTYNTEIDRWIRSGKPQNLDEFLIQDEKQIKWTRNAKRDLQRGRYVSFSPEKIRAGLYRPFSKYFWYPGKIFNKELALFPYIFPNVDTESENLVICVPTIGGRTPFWCLCASTIPNLNLTSLDPTQCFPFYTYAEDGTQRQENITDWALEKFQRHYADPTITKWDIFYSIYALLHQPSYRQKYAANLRRDLPHIPFVADIHRYATIGRRLAELHVHYDQQPEYPLEHVENPAVPVNWRVERMKLVKPPSPQRIADSELPQKIADSDSELRSPQSFADSSRGELIYNDFLTLRGIPAVAFDYRLGNRAALEWVVDQYQVSTDKRSGITNDPNNLDDERAIVRLIGQVITVSVETVKLVREL